MEEKRLLNTGAIPLLISGSAGKHYFELDENGELKYYFDKKGNGGWSCISKNILHQKISGFDSAVDTVGGTHLLGYDREGSILYLRLSPDTPNKPEILLKEEGKRICHLSFCTDKADRLHALYLASNNEREMWWLFYLRREDGRWLEKAVLDFGYFQHEQYGIIFCNGLTISFSFTGCTKMDTRWYCAVLKKNQISGTNILSWRKNHYCFYPMRRLPRIIRCMFPGSAAKAI